MPAKKEAAPEVRRLVIGLGIIFTPRK